MKAKRFLSSILLLMLCLSTVSQQGQAQQPVSQSSKTDNAADAFSGAHLANLLAQSWRSRQTTLSRIPARRTNVSHNGFTHGGFTLAPMAAPAVHGNGTVGKISMWVGTHPSGNSILGDSIITQLNGNIGIGLATPTSKLAVQGMIETTLGGYKFPDGTVQTTAAVSGLQTIAHDATLTGNGTSGSPLGLALPLVLKGPTPGCCIEDRVLTVWNTSDGNNGLLVIAGGSPGNTRTGGTGVFAFGGLSSTGDGGVGVNSSGGGSTTGRGGDGVFTHGGSSDSGTGGTALRGFGGTSNSGEGGVGVITAGGHSQTGSGGIGMSVGGGGSNSGPGGLGILVNGGSVNGPGGSALDAKGGASFGGGVGGNGVIATGGNFNGRGVVATGGIGSVGYGVEATGGASEGPGHTAGAGLFAKGGPSSGANSASGFGIFALAGEATNGAMRGRAGAFEGDVSISESLTVGGNLDVSGTKHFKIDHPLDPENKYLLHASVESSEVLNVYSGNVVTDAKGDAVVTLPDWFEALNRDLRYQLTVIGTFAQAIVANEVQNNRFTIKTNAANVKVSWQVTGVRSDKAMKKQPFKAEENKPERERGHYLRPELYDQPEERGVEWARNPELIKQLRQREVEAGQRAKRQPNQP
jgi:trimeric autotransporter adhesin